MSTGSRRAAVVSADLTVAVTAPDGSATMVRVSDRDGEVIADVDRPLALARSLPARRDLRRLARLVAALTPSSDPAVPALPPLRVRTGGRTVAVVHRGRVRPSPALAGAAAVALVGVVASVLAVVRALSGPGGRTDGGGG